MKLVDDNIHLSATDLANHLGCRHATQLDRALVEGRVEAAEWRDPNLAVLAERGLRHEQAYLEHLRAEGRGVVELPVEGLSRAAALAQAVEAMKQGHDVIAQAALGHGRWFGRADVLKRVEVASKLGGWSYMPEDTKLSRETRASAVLQLCLYADLLAVIQGVLPETLAVVSPGKGFVPETHRVLDYLAYYRFVKGRLEREVELPLEPGGALPTEAEPVSHCDVCRWWSYCDGEWRRQDHLSLVANLSHLQRGELRSHSVSTLAGLAQVASPPWPWKPERGSREALAKSREQARVQLEGRRRQSPYHELLAREPARGFELLPEPDSGDIFFDFEGDPFVEGGGLEYLFGWVTLDGAGQPRYDKLWALDRAQELAAFERFMDFVMARWAQHPKMHVYHYASYEPAHLKILSGRHAVRLDELDAMLRGGLFVDLFTAVRQGVRASVESYSIKKLEAFYGFRRELDLDDAGAGRRTVEHTLELDPGAEIPADVLQRVALYNQDDCVSTLRLRDWLEQLRAGLVAGGEAIARPAEKDSEANEAQEAQHAETAALQARLLDAIPADPLARNPEQRGRWLLAQLLDFHRREANCFWWEHFRLVHLDEEEACDERLALGGLKHLQRSKVGRATVDRYAFPPQDSDIEVGDALQAPIAPGSDDWLAVGTVEAIDYATCTVDIRKPRKAVDLHPAIVFHHDFITPKELQGALRRLGAWVADHGIEGAGQHRAARDLLLRLPPPLPAGEPLQPRPGEAMERAAGRVALALDGGVLPIQGPPGTGKTYTGAQLILDLVGAGKRVGVTANSHKVIDNLLGAVVEAGAKRGDGVRCGHKDAPSDPRAGVEYTNQNGEARAWLESRGVTVLGGTPYMWAREDFAGAVDVLVVDEAGQLSLANALVVAQAAGSLVLLGDPRQLDQPMQASHPEGCAVSALEHLLGDQLTVPADRGLFLPETRRLHPSLCEYTGEVFYGGRLRPLAGLENQRVSGSEPLAGSGLRLVPVAHQGNTNISREEVHAVDRLVRALLSGGRTWTDAKGVDRPLSAGDILVVAPYNAQVDALRRRLPGFAIGTVDKFQGQQAPIVIVSLASSSAQEAPRGMGFLYSPNRLNVATSRAQCACFLVASPALFEPECRTPLEMRLANAFCRYRELAGARE